MILIEIEEFEATDRVDLQGTTTANTHKQLKTSTHTTYAYIQRSPSSFLGHRHVGRCRRRRVLSLESGLTALFDSESSRLFGAVAAGKAQINTGKYVYTVTYTHTHRLECALAVT